MNNPIKDTITDRLPCRSIHIHTLRHPMSPVVIELKRPGKGRFIRREDLEPAEFSGTVRSAEITRTEMHTISPGWEHIEQVEEWVEQIAWESGAWDMVRFSKPPVADFDHYRESPGNGVAVYFCGLDAVYSIPGSSGTTADNWKIADVAAREGWWSWFFKPNLGFDPDSIELRLARRGDNSLRTDGSRPPPFPGWLRTGRFAGRSGDWWLGLAKSFEVSDDPGTALRIVWDFRKRMLGLGQ